MISAALKLLFSALVFLTLYRLKKCFSHWSYVFFVDDAPNDIQLEYLRYAACTDSDGYNRRGYDSFDESGRP